MEKTLNLCGDCEHCPQVVVEEEEVRIGDEGNLVRLKREEWNALVGYIKEGRLSKL